jgi:hypothetical protein
MTCQACEDLIQLHLDGVASPGDLERHLYACPDCAAERLAIERLVEGVRRLRPPAVPADVTERITADVLADRRVQGEPDWRWRAAVAVFALAASVAISLVAWAVWPGQSPTLQPRVVAEQPASLRDSMAEAQSAVVALTSRTANETVETTSQLLPLVAPSDLEAMAAMAGPIDPAMEPLREATSGVGAAVAPVADSARRAVGLFFRDLPMGRAPGDKNPG